MISIYSSQTIWLANRFDTFIKCKCFFLSYSISCEVHWATHLLDYVHQNRIECARVCVYEYDNGKNNKWNSMNQSDDLYNIIIISLNLQFILQLNWIYDYSRNIILIQETTYLACNCETLHKKKIDNIRLQLLEGRVEREAIWNTVLDDSFNKIWNRLKSFPFAFCHSSNVHHTNFKLARKAINLGSAFSVCLPFKHPIV